MSLLSGIIVALNSCCYDIAAAFLVVGLAAVRILSTNYPASGDAASGDAFLRVYAVVVRITFYAFYSIIVTGAVMALYLDREGGPYVFGYIQVVAVTVRYGLMLVLAVIGLFIWSGLSKKVGHLKSKRDV